MSENFFSPSGVIEGNRTRLTFRDLTADAEDRLVVVARFLALLELFRERAISFEQLTPLGELTIRWTGTAEGDLTISDEFDEPTLPDEQTDERRP